MTCSNNNYVQQRKSRKPRLLYTAGFCVICVLLNLLVSRLVGTLNLPLYLDCIGSIVAAVLGGYVPGIIVGYLTNILGAINDPINIYYAVTNVLIAACATWLFHKGFFSSWKKLIVPVLAFAVIGGGLGSLLTFAMYGLDFGTGISAPLAHTIYDQGVLNPFFSQLLADLLLDVVDKFITVTAAYAILRSIPQSLKAKLDFEDWAMVSRSIKMAKEHNKAVRTRDEMTHYSLSLRAKVVMLISIAILFISTATVGISVMQYHKVTIEDHEIVAKGAANLAASAIIPAMVDTYLRVGEDAPGYKDTEAALTRLRESTPDIQYVYAYRILEDGCHVVFDLDTEELEGAPVGEVIPFDESFEPYISTLLEGGEMDVLITDDSYGWLMTAYVPVKTEDGKCQCYAAVDISMDKISLKEIGFVAKVLSLFMSFFVLVLAFGLYAAQSGIITPINTMAMAADDFAYTTEEARKESVERFNELGIDTGDEIENLYHSFSKTISDTMGYIEDVRHQNDVISRMQNGLILVLADMVESRDQCTGDHVRKTSAYTRVIMEQLRRDGKYTDILTDEFIADVENSAPLHDVGKIQVPDSLLNKPGRLTEEEFECMKTHTTAGGQIISQAMDLVSDSSGGYLAEARNLALYHHERWDGKGYPTGLAGEEIPLSARIMAVADVFDALVSRRSYKEPFSFEKAMSIIKEESGTHFDPSVVDAFVEAQDEVQRISQMHMDGKL